MLESPAKAEPIAPPLREPNAVAALAQTVAGLLVPLILLRPFLRVIAPRRPGAGGALRTLLLFGFAGFWLMLLAMQAGMYAFLGFPPFKNPPKFDPLTAGVVGWAMFRAFLGAVQFQLGTTLVFDWLFFRKFGDIPTAPDAF